jgi:DNA-binding FadR family transcriptional regulator
VPDRIPINLRDVVLQPLARYGRADEVQRRLTEAIELGLYADGEQLPGEVELSRALGISPVTLREALAGLKQLGLLETRRGRGGGTFVSLPQTADDRLRDQLRRWSASELRDFSELHAATAEATARLAAQRARSSDLARLGKHVEQLRIAASPSARTIADSRFHIELAAASNSIRLTRSEMELQAQIAGLLWSLARELDVKDRVVKAARAHDDVVEAVRRHRPEAAARSIRAHLRDESELLVGARLRMYGDSTPSRIQSLEGVARVTRRFVKDVFSIVARVRDQVLSAWDGHIGSSIDPKLLEPLARLGAQLDGTGTQSIEGLGVAFLSVIKSPRVAWWSANRGLAPLAVDVAPGHRDYCEYESAEWFTTTLRRGAFYVAGPFIDLVCAHTQLCTFAAPIIAHNGTSLGVAGADVGVHRLEETVVPVLRRVRHRTALLNSAGIIVASNSGDLPPGSQCARPPSRLALPTEDAVLVDSSSGWWVCRFK